MILSASTSLRVLRTLGTSVADSSTRSVAYSSAVSVASSSPDGVSMSTYLERADEQFQHPLDVLAFELVRFDRGLRRAQHVEVLRVAGEVGLE